VRAFQAVAEIDSGLQSTPSIDVRPAQSRAVDTIHAEEGLDCGVLTTAESRLVASAKDSWPHVIFRT
jgi:hypothetical protein